MVRGFAARRRGGRRRRGTARARSACADLAEDLAALAQHDPLDRRHGDHSDDSDAVNETATPTLIARIGFSFLAAAGDRFAGLAHRPGPLAGRIRLRRSATEDASPPGRALRRLDRRGGEVRSAFAAELAGWDRSARWQFEQIRSPGCATRRSTGRGAGVGPGGATTVGSAGARRAEPRQARAGGPGRDGGRSGGAGGRAPGRWAGGWSRRGDRCPRRRDDDGLGRDGRGRGRYRAAGGGEGGATEGGLGAHAGAAAAGVVAAGGAGGTAASARVRSGLGCRQGRLVPRGRRRRPVRRRRS